MNQFLKFKKDELIRSEGDLADGIYEIIEGSIIIKNIFQDGSEGVIKMLGKGDRFGDILIFSKHSFFPASIYALSPTTLLFTPTLDVFQKMKDVDYSQNLLFYVSEQAYALNNKVKLLNRSSIRERICYFLYTKYNEEKKLDLLLPMNRNQMSSYLNVNRPSLSRELIRMKKDGIIDFYLNSIRIIDINKLESYL